MDLLKHPIVQMVVRRPAIQAGLLLFVAVLVYLPAMQGGFVWNDDTFVYENAMIKAEDGLRRFWMSTEPPDYFPLTSTALWLEWRLWGMDAMGYHVVNLFFHLVSLLLIWRILLRLKIPGAWLATLIFAVHPVNVEAVAWITQHKSTIPLIFYSGSILFYLNYEERNQWRWYALSLVCFPLALLAKTSVVMLPFVLLGCIWWQRGTIGRRDIVRILPYFFVAFIFGLITIWFQYNSSIGDDIVRTDSFLSRLALAGWTVWFYLYKALLPLKVIFVYPRWSINEYSLLPYLPDMALVLLLGLFWKYRTGWGRPFLFGVGYFVVTLFPVMGFFNIYFMRYSLVADHWQYQSIIGIIALVTGLGVYGWRRLKRPATQRVMLVLTLIIIGLLSAQTWRQARAYKNSETLLLDTISKNPGSWMAHYNLAHQYQEEERFEEALDHYYTAQNLLSDNADPMNNIGNIMLAQGKAKAAVESFKKALTIKPDFAEAHYNLGVALMDMNRLPEAAHHLSVAIQLDPGNARAHNNIGNVLARLGQPYQALPHYQEALRLDPGFDAARKNMGIVLQQIQMQKQAGGPAAPAGAQ